MLLQSGKLESLEGIFMFFLYSSKLNLSLCKIIKKNGNYKLPLLIKNDIWEKFTFNLLLLLNHNRKN